MLGTRLNELGVPVSAVLRRAGLPQDLFKQTRILVSTPELFALWRAIAEVSKDSSIGLKLGTETKMERFHPMVLAALSTETFGAAITHMAHYKKLSAPEEILQEHTDDEWSIRFLWTLALEAEPAVLIEHCFAWVLTIARQGTGTKISPLRVELLQPRAHGKALERYFGCPVVCGSVAECAGVSPRGCCAASIDTQCRTARHARTPVRHRVEATRARRRQLYRIGAWSHPAAVDRSPACNRRYRARSALESANAATPPAGVWIELSESARRSTPRMARYYLQNSVLDLAEAAYLLGYEDANSFTRAFRNWEGVPPRHWRETNQKDTSNAARPN